MMTENTINSKNKTPISLIEVHFFSLSSQGNVFTISELVDDNGFEKILVATLQRKIYCIEYLNCRPCMREILFPYIPSDVEIISIGAFNKSEPKDEFIVGISLIKKNDGSEVVGQQLNFYCWDLTTDANLERLSTISLPYIPYFLQHFEAINENKWQTVWLLTGSDGCAHIYSSSETARGYEETHESYFPELIDVDSIILRVNVLYDADKSRRKTVTCDESGEVRLCDVDLTSGSPTLISVQNVTWDSLTASIAMFPIQNTMESLADLFVGLNRTKETVNKWNLDDVNIVVANCFEPSYVYKRNLGKESRQVLQASNSTDVVTCCLVCDISHDGDVEILIGTYGRVVRIYKQNTVDGDWYLFDSLSVSFPILALKYLDLVGDGSKQLVVMTTDGIHIFQHNPRNIAKMIMARLKKLKHRQKVEAVS